MKKLCVLMAVLVLLSSFSASVFAADSDFDVRNGVLVKYSGSDASVTLPSGISAIGASAFKGNTKLRSLTIPSGVYSVGEQAFYGCSSLQTVTGGDDVCEMGDLAFNGTPYLDKSSVKYLMLGHVLLWYNGTSQSVSIPTRCTAVASYAFMKCDYLTAFNAYDGLISIGTGAFYGCSNLVNVTVPSTVSAIGAYAFDGTPYLESLGEFATAGDHVLIKYQGADTAPEVPEGVRRISSHAFSGSKLTYVTLPDSVYAIDRYAFADCTGLTGVSMNEGLVSIGDGAFRGCKSFGALKTPASLSYIGQQAFRGSSVSGVVLKGSNMTVSYNAFKGCDSLKYVLLSDGVSAVFDNAFDGCAALKGISVPAAVSEISAQSLSNCPNVTISCEDTGRAQTAWPSLNVSTESGDADNDGMLTVIDATLIQFYIADLLALDGDGIACADYNFDAEIDVVDAFLVQMKSAGLV